MKQKWYVYVLHGFLSGIEMCMFFFVGLMLFGLLAIGLATTIWSNSVEVYDANHSKQMQVSYIEELSPQEREHIKKWGNVKGSRGVSLESLHDAIIKQETGKEIQRPSFTISK